MLPPARMFEVRQKPDMVERALLVRFFFDAREADESGSLLEELGELVKTLGIEVVETVLCRSREMHKKFLCGTGKADEMVELARAHECDVIVIDNGLAPSQQREWERLADLCVIDREEVILDIFAKRAHTKEARLQVELARMQYALPRLARMWGHLDAEGFDQLAQFLEQGSCFIRLAGIKVKAHQQGALDHVGLLSDFEHPAPK